MALNKLNFAFEFCKPLLHTDKYIHSTLVLQDGEGLLESWSAMIFLAQEENRQGKHKQMKWPGAMLFFSVIALILTIGL